jgi:outer membrane protein OmpA-like peptidoglycan-associated protein
MLLPAAAKALSVDLPAGAVLQLETVTPSGSYSLPTAPFAAGILPALPIDGQATRQAWRLEGEFTTLQIIGPLRDQLGAAGYDTLFECETEACGGFDFRFATEVLAPPAMHVDLGDYRFLAARGLDGGRPAFVSLLVSRTARAGYVQIIRVTQPDPDRPPVTETSGASPVPGPPDDFAAAIEAEGRVVLSDLTFETGAADLAPGDFASLRALAAYLAGNPARQVALVGHTDSEGALAGNIALSKRRATSVLNRMIADHGVSRSQIVAEGMGFLAPVASNLTEAGREANRRVEAILIAVD